MDNDRLEQFKDRLLAEKENLERDLKVFAVEDPSAKGKWRVKPPDFGSDTTDEDERVDKAEELVAELSIDRQLETRLTNVNAALAKMEQGRYGVCEKCGKEIEVERLKVNPEAQTHTSC